MRALVYFYVHNNIILKFLIQESNIINFECIHELNVLMKKISNGRLSFYFEMLISTKIIQNKKCIVNYKFIKF
ncbi:hypothetical protein KFK09_020619 [Dendrobium nobile]|uniref:Uncharacterized protein n=1 Tax=Dendrobium nobile TaxID=94219 RepID=A0A8T3ATI4_DENNO|nr:hypothetical protein KFK09_020619 [Dendrobium nobile]